MTKLEQEAENFALHVKLSPNTNDLDREVILVALKLGYLAGSNDSIKNYPCLREHK